MTTEDSSPPEQSKPKKLSKKHSAFLDEYLRCFNGTRAYKKIYPRAKDSTARNNASDLLANTCILAEYDRRLKESLMSADEAMQLLTDQGRANIGDFFKVGEEWVRWPLPTQEIIGEKEVKETDENGKVIETYPMYWVRRIYIDLDKLLDPKYARLVDEFSDSPKNGVSIKLPHKSDIADKILRVHGKYKDQVSVHHDGEITTKADDAERFDRAISTLASTLGKILPGAGTEQNGALGATERTPVAGAPKPGG